jgi:diguanylate cyclase (GGDEF)-like protein
MLAVWMGLSGANLAFAVAFPPNLKPPAPDTVFALVWVSISALLLLILAQRTPRWLVHVQLMASIVVTATLIYGAETNLGAALFGWAYSMVAIYASVWIPRRAALVYLLGMAATYLVTLGLRDSLPYMLVTWLITMTVCAAIALLLEYLVSSLRTMAIVDPLTGLFNRAGLESVLGAHRSFGTPTSLVVIDLDNFKALNDSEGHLAGDRMLRGVGQAIRRHLSDSDFAFRTGGDEFMLILPASNASSAEHLIGRLTREVDLGMSVGIVEWSPDEDFDAAMSRADALMYQEKGTERR